MKLFSFFYYCFLFIFLLANKGFSQENYAVRWYTSDNNELPQNSVKAIVRDKYGFIWMTTENGIVRYDGNTFLVFNPSTKFNKNRFTEIGGNVENDSLCCYNPELVLINRRIAKSSNIKMPYDHIVIRKEGYFYPHYGLPTMITTENTAGFRIKLSNSNNYLISTKKIELDDSKLKCIYKIPYKNKSTFNFFTLNDTLYYLKEDGEYNCFFGRKIISGKLGIISSKDKFKLYWNATSKQAFLYSKNKIYLLSSEKNYLKATIIAEFEDFEDSNIISVFYDNENQRLYLGSSTNGLCILSFSSFKTIKRPSLKTDVYYSSQPFSDNSIITPEGLILNAEKIIDSIPFIVSKYYCDMLTIVKDDQKNIWLVRKGKLYCYLKKSNYKKYITYAFKEQIKTLYFDSNNTIWICLSQWGLKYKSRLYFISDKSNQKPTLALTLNTDISCFSQYDSNTFYLGSEKGLYKYEIPGKKLFHIKNSENINVRSIFIDKEKRIWLTTYEKGFFLYSNARLYSFPKDENNYLNSSHTIIEDRKGFFWIPTNKGLFQASKQSLLQYTKDKTKRIYYHHYDKANGFSTNEFNGGCQPCGNYLKNGYICFPSMDGMVFFNPDKTKPLLPNKEIFVDKAILDQKTIYFKDTIVLKNNFQKVEFLIDYPYYSSNNNLNIEVGFNKHWEKIGSKRSISFTALPPGEYALIIRKLSGCYSNYTYKRITIIVPALFYQTSWFKILCYILSIVIISLLWQIRLYYVKKKNRQLKLIVAKKTRKLAKTIVKLKSAQNHLTQEVAQQKKLVKIISHDIKSPLKYLNLSMRHLYDKIEARHDEKFKEDIKSVYTSSTQLYEYVENLIQYSIIFIEGKKLEDKSYLLYELVQSKIQLFEGIAISKNTSIINSIDKKKLIKTNSKILSIIIHNLLDNAIKNTENGTVAFMSEIKEGKLFLTVKDSGRGMSEELINYYHDFYKKPDLKNFHLGLHMIIELIIMLKGDIKIASEINKGTTIVIIVDYT